MGVLQATVLLPCACAIAQATVQRHNWRHLTSVAAEIGQKNPNRTSPRVGEPARDPAMLQLESPGHRTEDRQAGVAPLRMAMSATMRSRCDDTSHMAVVRPSFTLAHIAGVRQRFSNIDIPAASTASTFGLMPAVPARISRKIAGGLTRSPSGGRSSAQLRSAPLPPPPAPGPEATNATMARRARTLS